MEVKQFIENNLENMKSDLRELVSFNSVLSDDELPFGSTNRKVLEKALELMNKNGLNANNVDYYCGYGETGSGDKTIGILAHLDIVPSGDGWDSDPFTLTEKDGVLYGRGVSDDKGAAVASMYAIKYLIDEKYPFKKKVRLILGCNEENGSKCIEYYVKKHGHIDCGFTPDGEFPGIYAEKGMISGKIVGHNSKIMDLYGGDVSNAVCKTATAKLPLDSFDEAKLKAYLDSNNIKFDITKDDAITLTVHGMSAHASTPEKGINAFSYMMEALYNSDFNDTFVTWFHNLFALTLNGEILGYESIADDISNTTINFGVLSMEGKDVCATLDMRYPVKSTGEKAKSLLENHNDENNEIIINNIVNPLYFGLDSPMISALKKAYVDITGDTKSEMQAIGGGTYAKEIHNCIAFGCQFDGESNHIHDVNERLSIDSFKKQVELYVEAIKNLNEI